LESASADNENGIGKRDACQTWRRGPERTPGNESGSTPSSPEAGGIMRTEHGAPGLGQVLAGRLHYDDGGNARRENKDISF
jgi:hypothetical protein